MFIRGLTMKKSRLRNLLICFAHVATFAVLGTPAYGAPIPGGSDSSADLLLNFDLTADGTSYSSVTLTYFFSSPEASGGDGGGELNEVPVTVDIFGGLNGESLLTTISIDILGVGTSPDDTELFLAGVRDGLFSIGLRVAPGVTASGFVTAFGEYTIPGGGGDGQGPIHVTTDPVVGIPQETTSVPEPTTLALLGSGLLGLGFARRRKQ